MPITVLIAGLNRSPRRGTLAIVETLAGRSTCAFELDDPLGEDAAPKVGEEVLIAADGDRIFAGSIETVDVTLRSGSQARVWALTCIDYHRILDRRLAGQKVYNAKRSDLIIGDICINSLQGEGVDFTFVQQGPVLEEFKTDFETAAEAIDRAVKLAKQFWTIDYFKNLRVFSPETYNCPFEIASAGLNYESLTVRSSREMYANRVVARIGEFLREPQTATFNASGRQGDGEDPLADLKPDGARKSFWVTYPIHAAPAVKVNGVDKYVGISGVDTFMDWYWSAGSNTIEQDDAATPLAATDVLEVTYVGIVSNVVDAQNGDEISQRAAQEGNSGIYEVLKEASTPQNSAQAQQFAQSALDQLDELSAVAVFSTTSFIEPLASTARVGQRIHVDVDGYQVGGRIGGIAYGTPCVITAASHGRQNGERVRITGAGLVDGTWTVANATRDTFELAGSSASGAPAGVWIYPCSYIIRQIRIMDMGDADGIRYSIEAVAGPIVGDAVDFFRQLAGATGVVPSGGLPPVQPGSVEEPPEPTQPAHDEFSIGNLLTRVNALGEQFTGIPITVILPADADYAEIWYYEGPNPPANPALYMPAGVTILKGNTNAISATWWLPRRSVSHTIQITVTASTDLIAVRPKDTSPVITVTIPASSTPQALTSVSITATHSDDTGVRMGRYEATLSGDADVLRQYVRIQRWRHNASWQPADANEGPLELATEDWGQDAFSEKKWTQDGYDWGWPRTENEYWKVRAGAVGFDGQVTWSAWQNLTLVAGGGVVVEAIPTGSGIGVDDGELVGTAQGGLVVLNPGFEFDDDEGNLADWVLIGACSVDETVAESGGRSLKLQHNATDGATPTQYVRVYPGGSYQMQARVRNDGPSTIRATVTGHSDRTYASWTGQVVSVDIPPSAGVWQTVKVDFINAGANVRYLMLAPARIDTDKNPATVAWVDNVRLAQINDTRLIGPGVLSDLTGPGWSSSARPMGIGSTLPSLPSDAYPAGAYFYYTGSLSGGETSRLRRSTGTAWVGLDGGEIVTGTLGAGVIYAGEITVGQIAAGNFSGFTMTLSKNYVTTIFDVLSDSVYGTYCGLKVQSETYTGAPHNLVPNQRAIVTSGGIAGIRPYLGSEYVQWQIACSPDGGSIGLSGLTGNMTVQIIGNTGTVQANQYKDGSGNLVVRARSAIDPTTLSDVIAILKYHGLCA